MLTSADGIQIYANSAGRAPAHGIPTIVFIHGFLMCASVFDSIFRDEVWTRSACLVRYDARGQGRSGKPLNDTGWESKRFAEDFEAVVKAFGLHQPYVAGCHAATNITDILSFHPPAYLAGVIYISPLPYTGSLLNEVGSKATLACVPGLTKPISVPVFQSAVRRFVDLCSGSGRVFSFTMHQMCLGNAILQSVETSTQLLARTQDKTGLLRAGREGLLPLLFIYGTHDEVAVYGPALRAITGWTRLETRAMDAGHAPWMQQPGVFRETVLQWIDRVEGGGAAIPAT
ncbi:Alpha/Beta hydrolase protein [Infundibulicybe gibba]|nr:Alpha/Beta hydrolase protein [Infundibulicybe gibba]